MSRHWWSHRAHLSASCAGTLSAVLVAATSSYAAGPDLRLIEAAKRQDRQAIQVLLRQGVDVNAPQGDGATALHWAVYLDDLATVNLLLGARASVNAADDLGVTVLSLACRNANGVIVAKLLAAGADPKRLATPTGETPVMAAARSGSVDAVQALVAHGADVNAVETSHGQTALMWAVANRHPAVVRTLIEGGANVNARSRIERVRMLVGGDRAMEVETGGSTPLIFAARNGDIESAKLLLAAGANVNDATPDQTSVLTFAAHSGHGAFAVSLLDQGADPNAEGSGYTALHAAVLGGDAELVKALLAHGANPNETLKQGTPVNRTSKDFAFFTEWIGATPFWLAAKFAEVEIMHSLVAGGADPQAALPDGTTALMAAAGLGRRGQNPETEDRRGRRRDPTEFIAVAESLEPETLEAVTFVTGTGADVNAANAAGDTAVHAAVVSKATSVVQWLADHGAKLSVANKRSQTPLSIANTRTRRQSDEGSIDTKMVELLRRLGATQ